MNCPYDLIKQLLSSFDTYQNHVAFHIDEVDYTYQQLKQKVASIMQCIHDCNSTDAFIGVMAYNDIETYASILAIILSGKGYMPVNPLHPADRNYQVIQQSGISILFNSKANDAYIQSMHVEQLTIVSTQDLLVKQSLNFVSFNRDTNRPAYLLFTSGSTGIPKGVPITLGNVECFLDSFFTMIPDVTSADKFLQQFDLTFDLSVMSYLAPLTIGASVYPVPHTGIRYMDVYSILEDKQITFALMVPSVIACLQPYFGDINLSALSYSLFCGEALNEEVTKQWSACAPNAKILNVYGPTENTIFCLYYEFISQSCKSLNGIVSIGKPMKYVDVCVIDDDNNEIAIGEKGELCLAGGLLTPGYWNDEEKNKQAFFSKNGITYYKTGDIVFADEQGDMLFTGRKDQQIKIQGYRVELSEIEHHVREELHIDHIACIAKNNSNGTTELHLFIEIKQLDAVTLKKKLKEKLPDYMIPSEMHCIEALPLNVNGKIDRKKLLASI